MASTLPPAANFPLQLLGPTQGQWWSADYLGMPGTERRVDLVAGQMGYMLWTATFRGEVSGHRFFVSRPGSSEPVAVFETLADREAWLQANWPGRPNP